MKQETARKISTIMFATGVLIGFLLAVSSNWAHLELPFYFGYTYATVPGENQGYSKLMCPILLTRADSGQVAVDITNSADKAINIRFQVEISSMDGTERNAEFTPSIQPGETSRIQFEVNQDDVVFNNLILVRTYQFSTYKTPSRMGSCSILFIPISFVTGNHLWTLTMLLAGVLILSGIILWIRNNHPLHGSSRNTLTVMAIMAFLLLAAVVMGIEGWWIPGLLVLVVALLLVIVSIGYFINTKTRD